MNRIKCTGCGELVDETTTLYANLIEGSICEVCNESEGERPSTLVKYERGEKELVHWGDYQAWSEGGEAPDWFIELLGENRRKWVSTDPWRGYYETKLDGLVKLADGWVTEWTDETTKRKEPAVTLHELLQAGEILPAPLYWLFESTSNVFSTASEILCRPQDKSILIKWLDKRGYTLEDLQEAFS